MRRPSSLESGQNSRTGAGSDFIVEKWSHMQTAMSKQSPDFISKPERSSLKDQREGTEQCEFLYRSNRPNILQYLLLYSRIQVLAMIPAFHQPSLQSAKVLHFPSNNKESTESPFDSHIFNP